MHKTFKVYGVEEISLFMRSVKWEMSQLMRLWYLSHRQPVKGQASLHICAVSPEPSLFAHIKYGSRRRCRQKIRHLAPLDGCACAFEEWVYGGRKVPQFHEFTEDEKYHNLMTQMMLQIYTLIKCDVAVSRRSNIFPNQSTQINPFAPSLFTVKDLMTFCLCVVVSVTCRCQSVCRWIFVGEFLSASCLLVRCLSVSYVTVLSW